MHIRQASIRNIRSLAELSWNVDEQVGRDLAGWHVILGDNGSGKSSMLGAIALALNGPEASVALRQSWSSWLRRGEQGGAIELRILRHGERDWYLTTSASAKLVPTPEEVQATLRLTRHPAKVENGRVLEAEVVALSSESPDARQQHVWSGAAGWFSASYGPLRHFSGGYKDIGSLYDSNPRLARHLTMFGESLVFSRITKWLQKLKFAALEQEKAGQDGGGPSGQLLLRIFDFINDSNLLPHGTRIHEVSSKHVSFVDAEGCDVALEDLSDGHRWILSMVFELLRNLVQAFGLDSVFDRDGNVGVPGVVLVDEIDAHLHPRWQGRIGPWFTERFPRMQFIVTTHSPLICRAAERGTIFRLPRPGSEDESGFVTGHERDRLLYGNVLDAYDTLGFGVIPTRSKDGHRKLQRLADLDLQARTRLLDPAEEAEREHLRTLLPTHTP